MNDWLNTSIVALLRIGVVISIALIATGLTVTFVRHPDYFSSRPALGALTSPDTHFPSTLRGVVDGVQHGRGQAIAMLGLLVLIATPVARVALSLTIFLMERDKLYAALTAAVLAILILSFAIGAVAG